LAQRSTQQDRYALDFQSSIETAVSCLNGIDTGKSGITMFNHSSLYANQNILSQEKTVRSASRNQLVEYQNTTTNPSVSFQIMLSPKLAFAPFRLFFQRGSLQDSEDSTVKWFFPYSFEEGGSTCETWATIVRDLSSGETHSHRLIGAVSNRCSISIDPTEYGIINCEFIGKQYDFSYNSSGDNFTLSTDAPLLWRNCVTKIGNSYNSLETFDFKELSLSLSNSVVGKKFNNASVQRFVLGKIEGTGSFVVPWENSSTSFTYNTLLSNLLSGNVTRLSMYWGRQYVDTGSTVSINLLIRYNKGGVSSDDEISSDMAWELVEDASFSSENGKIVSWEIDSSSANIVHVVFAGTETLIGNVFPGDVILTLDAVTGQNIKWKIEKILTSTSLRLSAAHVAGVGASGSNFTIIRHPINIGINDKLNRNIT